MIADYSQLKYVDYYRKSSDAEDRQVQSIPDQKLDTAPLIGRYGLKIIKTFEDEKTATKPGRPGFNEMLNMVEQGKADTIICWAVNRLARNPIDGGRILWLLQQGVIKAIITPTREYLPSDNVLMLTMEFGMATQFSLDLSKVVLRGMTSKANKGWRPSKAPIGYLNDPYGLKGEKQIFPDPERFDLVRKMWDLLLTGNYTIKQVINKANEEFGLRNKKGGKLSLSSGYQIFTNTFYYCEYSFMGEIKHGRHKAMVSKQEFDLAQIIMGRAGKPRPKHKRLPFNGVIACGECGSMITADEKRKYVKREDKVKQLIYHRCTKRRKGAVCHQKPIKYENLAGQIQKYLDGITIPPEFLHWAIEVLRDNSAVEEGTRVQMLANQRKQYDACLERIQNLINFYVSPENANRQMLSDEEYKTQKNRLIEEKNKAEAEIRKIEQNVDGWLDLTEKTFNFATYAKVWFDKGDYEQKTHILRALGKNFTLSGGKLHIDLQKPFVILKEGLEVEPLKTARLEPALLALDKTQSTPLGGANSRWSG